MAWATSNRTQRLPKNWQHLRQQTASQAKGQCQARLTNGTRCPNQGTQCDHIQPGDNHTPDNLQWLCAWHHTQKTSREAAQASRTKHQKNQPQPRQHPGYK